MGASIETALPDIDGASSLKYLGPDTEGLAAELLGDQIQPPYVGISHLRIKYMIDKPVSEGYRQRQTLNPPGTEIAPQELKEGHTRLL